MKIGNQVGFLDEGRDQVDSGLFLDNVVRDGVPILQWLPSSKDKTLHFRRNAVQLLNLGLDTLNSVGGLHLEGHSGPSETLHKDRNDISQSEVQDALHLDVVVTEGSAIFQLLAKEG